MFEQIASEVRALNERKPIRPFKPARFKVACIGNCVVNKMAYLLALQPDVDAVFCSNLSNWGNYHADSFFERAEQADVVVALNASGASIFHEPDDLRSRLKGKCVFAPLIWLEGLDSLQMFSIRGQMIFFGGGPVARAVKDLGVDAAYGQFVRGELRTSMPTRFASSLARLKANEVDGETVRISDFIEETYRDRRVMHAVGHPDGSVVGQVFDRLSGQLGIAVDRGILSSRLMLGRMTLPTTPKVLSPHDIDELGLRYDHDPAWMLSAKSLFSIVAAQIKNGSYATGGTDVA